MYQGKNQVPLVTTLTKMCGVHSILAETPCRGNCECQETILGFYFMTDIFITRDK